MAKPVAVPDHTQCDREMAELEEEVKRLTDALEESRDETKAAEEEARCAEEHVERLETEMEELREERDAALLTVASSDLPHTLPDCSDVYPMNPWSCAKCAAMKEAMLG